MKIKLFEESGQDENDMEEKKFSDGYLAGYLDCVSDIRKDINVDLYQDEDIIEKSEHAYVYYKRKRPDLSQLRIPYTQSDIKWNKDDSHLKKNKL